MSERLKKIGSVKATIFNKQFDSVYDLWKKRAQDDFNYWGELRFIKEHNLVFIYTVINIEDPELIDPEKYKENEGESDFTEDEI